MFSTNTPNTGNGTQRAAHRSPRNNVPLKIAAIGTTAALGTALALAAPLAASAATPRAIANGHFLTGSVLGTNLDNVAAIEAATAQNNGSQSMQTSRDPLGVSVLKSQLINQPAGVQLNLGQIIDLGAAGQYAQASKDGSSMAASGAVTNDGGIGVGKVGTDVGGNATVDLDSLIGSRFDKVITDLKLQAIAVAAQAKASGTTASGTYSLAGLKLNLTSPAVAKLDSKVSNALDPVTSRLDNLGGSDGYLAQSVNGVTTRINPLLNVLGAHASVSAKVNANLGPALKSILTGDYTSNGVTANLQTGAVSVDLAALLGGKLNSEPAGTEVLSDKVINEILNGITGNLSTISDQVVDKVKAAIANANVSVDVAVNQSTAQAPIISKVCTKTSDTSSNGGGSTGLIGGIVGGLLGTTTGTVTTIVGDLVCKTTTKVLPNLPTSLAVHVGGTVGKLANGDPTVATAKLTLLGKPVAVSAGSIASTIGATLSSHLLGSNSPVSDLTSSLQSKLVDPAVTGLTGSGSSVEDALTHVLSVTLNNQAKNSDGTFTETALKVGVLPTTTSTTDAASLATVNLASATVGPNVKTVVPPTTGDPGDPTSPANPSDPGNPISSGNPSNPTNPASLGSLAFTGVGITGLILAILALLAAGAYLVREGYRRNSRRQIV